MGRPPLLTGSGLVCLAVALPGYERGARWLRFARKYLSGMFPVPAATVRLQQRLRTASPLVKKAFRVLATDTDLWFDNHWIASSTPVPCEMPRPTVKRPDLAGWAGYGYCASHSRFSGPAPYLVQVNRYVQQRASLAKPPHHRSSARILRSVLSGSTVLDARCIYLGSTPAAVITDRTRRFRELRVSAGPMFAPCLLGCRGTARQRAAPRGSRSPGLPYSPARHSIARHHAPLLLIRGFGVQVPGGAPVLTWGYTESRFPREGRFRPMFAPRLLVSPDLVPRAALVGLAPARSARLVRRVGHVVGSGTTPADDITQRDIYPIVQLEDPRPRTQVHARSIGGTCEVHRAGGTWVPQQISFARFCCSRSGGRQSVCPCGRSTRGQMSAEGSRPRGACTCSASLVTTSRTLARR